MDDDQNTYSQDEKGSAVSNTSQSQDDSADLKRKCEEYKAGWQRAQADYQNLQKEVSIQRSHWIKMSEIQILEEFIPVYDNLKKAFGNEQGTMNKEQQSWVKGIEYIMKQFGNVLKQHEVGDIKTVGEKFDPRLHEAVGEEESADHEIGTVIREIEAGYVMGEKVVKVAKVVVAKQKLQI